jgi:hypothetical protein
MRMPNGSIEGGGTTDCECGQPRGNREVRMANLEEGGRGENCDSGQPSEGQGRLNGGRFDPKWRRPRRGKEADNKQGQLTHESSCRTRFHATDIFFYSDFFYKYRAL